MRRPLTMQSSALWAVPAKTTRNLSSTGRHSAARPWSMYRTASCVAAKVLVCARRLCAETANAVFPRTLSPSMRTRSAVGGARTGAALRGARACRAPAARKRSRCSAALLLTLCCRIGGVEAEALPRRSFIDKRCHLRLARYLARVYQSSLRLAATTSYRSTESLRMKCCHQQSCEAAQLILARTAAVSCGVSSDCQCSAVHSSCALVEDRRVRDAVEQPAQHLKQHPKQHSKMPQDAKAILPSDNSPPRDPQLCIHHRRAAHS